MIDLIIILVVALLLLFALRGSIRHFKEEGSCCGGRCSFSKRDEKHLDGPVISTKRVMVSGMHCENCAERVRSALESIDGAVCTANWKEGTVILRCDREIPDDSVRKAIADAGYSAESIT